MGRYNRDDKETLTLTDAERERMNKNMIKTQEVMTRGDDVKITPENTFVPIKPLNGKFYGLRELQQMVGGMIELIDMENGRYMVVNEEGKIFGLPMNNIATGMYLHLHRAVDYIVGNALYIDKNHIQ